MSPPRLRQPSILAVFLIWTAVGLFSLGQSAVIRGSPVPLSQLVLTAVSIWLWALYTPLIWWLSERYPFDQRRVRAALIHAAAAFALLFAEAALNVTIVMPALGMPPRRVLRNASDLLLGDVLRGALRQTEPEVALRDELGLAERYLDLERARFGDALSFSVEAEPDTAAAQVPSLLLQPLVENALKHGRGPDGRAHVRIRAQRQGPDLRIEVRDTGSGPAEGAQDG